MKRGLVLGAGSLISILFMTVVFAAWTATVNPSGATRSLASSLPSGNQPTAVVNPPTDTSVAVSWTPSTGGAPVSGYEIRSYDASTGAPRTVGAACSGLITGSACTETAVPAGSWRYSVVPRLVLWFGVESTRSTPVVIDPTPPTVAITFPTAGGSYTSTTWDAGCSSGICGTAADAGTGVASVQVSIRQGSGSYWNGTAFASGTEVLVSATGTTSWALAFPAATFPADGSYTVRAVATDGLGLAGTTASTFTIDATRPTTTALVMTNGNGVVTPNTDEIRITYSEPLATSSICSAWSGTGDQSLGAGTVVSFTKNGGNDTVGVSSSACTLNVGSVATGRVYFLVGDGAMSGTVTWTAATRTLTIRLGTVTSGLANVLGQGATTVTYTPGTAITDANGNAIVTTPFASASQHF